MQKIHFTVFSQAYYVDAVWGFGCPSGGMRNFGNLCHKYKIPVTWMVSPKSARCEQEMLTEYHEKFGDDVGLFFRYPTGEKFHHSSERAVAQALSVEDYRQLLQEQAAQIKAALPWATIKIAGQGIRTPKFLQACLLEGYLGMFGHCYCQIGTDSITDFGMPWGSFPMRPGEVHRPALPDQSGLIAFEWTMRDLSRSLHTVRPELWSTDPNDVERGGVCTDDNVEYWKRLYEQYERALPLNEHGIWFQFHQEAHEQTWGEVCKPFTEDRVIFCTKMMDKFFEWLVQRPSAEFMTAAQAAEHYLKVQPKGTLPMYVPYGWTEVPDQMPIWAQIDKKAGYSGSIHKAAHLPDERLYDYLTSAMNTDPIQATRSPPWRDSFFYFDAECQLAFDIGKPEPFALFNYLNYTPDPDLVGDAPEEGGGAVGYFIEPIVPIPEIRYEKDRCIVVAANNPREKVLPYGVFLWETHFPGIISLAQKQSNYGDSIFWKISPDQGVFLRWNLMPGESQIKLFQGSR
jgi:hypothetical protein